MRLRLWSTTIAAVLLAGTATRAIAQRSSAPPTGAQDPFIWLEDVSSPRAMAWVDSQNTKTVAVLEHDPHYAALSAEAVKLAEAPDRIPVPSIIGGEYYNFWQDATHPHGIWRRASAASYRTATPAWTTVIDLDALSKSEKANWFWKGADCLEPAEHLCLVSLSDGGEDAVTVREFDLTTGAFVHDGFTLPHGKQDVAWQDSNTILVAREWNPGDVTTSGYPFIVKRLARGQPLSAAVEVFRGKNTDVSAGPFTLDDGSGHHAIFATRSPSFFETEHYILTPKGFEKLAIPLKASVSALVAGQLVIRLDTTWVFPPDGGLCSPMYSSPPAPLFRVGSCAGPFPVAAGSLASVPLADAIATPDHLVATVIVTPESRQSVDGVSATHDALIVTQLDNVRGRAYLYSPKLDCPVAPTECKASQWLSAQVAVPDNLAIGIVDADIHSATALLSVTGFLTPSAIWEANTSTRAVSTIKSLPAKFDASRDTVEQFEATSTDGTHTPYFVVHPRAMKKNGNNPTILNAYGGFQVSETPTYSANIGKLWLEHGGVWVLANIRGGGEFGPAWHEAGLKTHRQVIYDDFAAVGKDLVKRGITSARHLGIEGGSNGGLLMGVEFTQHPELWNAVDIQVPLLDMLRYEQIAAGASWVGEYGSVSVPAERDFLASISPYNNIKAGVKYPEPFIWTTTKDDRVGPQHARKFAAKLAAMHIPYLFYEVTEGGHGSGASLTERAHTTALEMTYFTRKLMN